MSDNALKGFLSDFNKLKVLNDLNHLNCGGWVVEEGDIGDEKSEKRVTRVDKYL